MTDPKRGHSPDENKAEKPFTAFNMGRNGTMVVDRAKLHESEGYKRQVAALDQLKWPDHRRSGGR